MIGNNCCLRGILLVTLTCCCLVSGCSGTDDFSNADSQHEQENSGTSDKTEIGSGSSTSGAQQLPNGPNGQSANSSLVGRGTAPVREDRDSQPPAGAGEEIRERRVMEDDVFPARRVVGRYVDGVLQGEARGYDEADRLIFVENYVDGKLHGARVCYYPSGAKFREENFEYGLAQGETTVWFADGTVASTGMFQDGEPHGEWTTNYFDGTTWLISHYENGVQHGDMMHYLPDGRLMSGIAFENGVEVFREVYELPIGADVARMNERGEFPENLKAHWMGRLYGPQPRSVEEPPPPLYQVGDEIQVDREGRWYSARIVEETDQGFRVEYFNNRFTTETVPPDRLRPIPQK